MQLALQPADLDEFAKLPVKWRTKIDLELRVLRQLDAGQITKAEAMAQLQVSRSTVDRKLADLREAGWRGLVRDYKGGTPLPGDFVDFWKTLVESNQRKTAPAIRKLYRLWRDRHPIPGYAGHPGWPNLPAGWDARTLRRHQPSKLEMAALRHGLGRATSLHAPKVLSTRKGLWHLSHIVWDDVWLDFKACHLLTQRDPCRVLQIGALDLLSGSRFHWGQRPQLLRANGTRESLSEADMRFALAAQLHNYGISARGTTMVVEHGTAAIRDNVRDILARAFGDLIRIEDSGMTGKLQAIAGMGDGKGGGGNFRHKAALEGLHNLLHNELAFLPGQTGHGRDEPEFLGVLEREHKQLCLLAERVDPSIMSTFLRPFLEYHSEMVPTVDAILRAINERTDHRNQGWAECGFITRDYRLHAESSEWLPESKLMLMPPMARAAIIAAAKEDPRCLRPRNLSPAEVFEKGRRSGEVLQVPLPVIAEILYIDLAKPRKAARGMFEFQDKTLSPEPLTFEARIMRTDGSEEELRDGETYDLVVNPYDPGLAAGAGSAFVFSATRQRGAFLGIAKRVQRHCRADPEASLEAFKRQKKRLADLLADTRRRNVGRTLAITDRMRHNADVVEHALAQQRAAELRSIDATDASLPHEPEPAENHAPALDYESW